MKRSDYEKGYEQGKNEIREMKENADGCVGCAFENVEEWNLPCLKCKRNCKDFWRRGGKIDDRYR